MRHLHQELVDTTTKHDHHSRYFFRGSRTGMARASPLESSNNISSRHGHHQERITRQLHQGLADTTTKHKSHFSHVSRAWFASRVSNQAPPPAAAAASIRKILLADPSVQQHNIPGRRQCQQGVCRMTVRSIDFGVKRFLVLKEASRERAKDWASNNISSQHDHNQV